jgi:hypothetical protein
MKGKAFDYWSWGLLVLVALVMVMWSIPCQSATLRVRFTLPNQDNSGTCTAPVLLAMGANPNLKGHWRWWVAGGDSITAAVEDSLAGAPGAVVVTDYQVAQTLYRVRAWATDAGGVSCDTTVAIVPFKNRPWKPHW